MPGPSDIPRNFLQKPGYSRFLGGLGTQEMRRIALLGGALAVALTPAPSMAQEKLAPGETAEIAEEAIVYGLPLVMNYGVFYEYFVDKSGPQFKAEPNHLYNTARVYTPQDTAIVTPNSDTPYSFVARDLRAEPFVVCNPAIEKSRYFSLQLVDMYTFNFGYTGSRTTGNVAACAMITGPNWKRDKPEGIAKVFQSETDFDAAGHEEERGWLADPLRPERLAGRGQGEQLAACSQRAGLHCHAALLA
jgi:hypothetical protein